MLTHLYDSPPRGKPLAKFGTEATHTTHPGGGNIYPPTGRAPECRESPRMPPHLHDTPPRGEPLTKFGPKPTHTIPLRGGSLEKLCTGGRHPNSIPAGTHQRGGGWLNQTHREGG